MNHNIPTAYVVPADVYETMLERLENYELGLIVRERQIEKEAAVAVNINEL